MNYLLINSMYRSMHTLSGRLSASSLRTNQTLCGRYRCSWGWTWAQTRPQNIHNWNFIFCLFTWP